MKNKRLLSILGEIDDRHTIEAAPAAKKARKPVWVKWSAMAACLALVVIVGTMMFNTNDASTVLIGGVEREYGNSHITGGESAIEWSWEYKTLSEQYTSVMIDGREYVSTGISVDSTLLGETLGIYDVEGYDPYTEKKYQMQAEVFENSRIATEHIVAVKLGENYYTFTNREYNPPTTFGEVLDEYNLESILVFDRFSTYDGYTETGYFRLDDDGYIWEVLNDCRDAAFIQDDTWNRSEREYISFTATSGSLGVYKKVFYVSADGYIRTNIFDYAYLFQIGREAAEKILSYVSENGMEAVSEPYTNTLSGTITDISDGYILVNDSVLCKKESDGMTFKIPMDDLRISRCIDFEKIGVGDLVVVSFTGVIDTNAGNLVEGAYSLSKGTLSNGSVDVPE